MCLGGQGQSVQDRNYTCPKWAQPPLMKYHVYIFSDTKYVKQQILCTDMTVCKINEQVTTNKLYSLQMEHDKCTESMSNKKANKNVCPLF